MYRCVDPYLINRLERSHDPKPEDCLIIWKAGTNTLARICELREDGIEVINELLGGEIIHCRGARGSLKKFLLDEDVEVLHGTFPPLVF